MPRNFQSLRLAAAALACAAGGALAQPGWVQDGGAGFVVSSIRYALAADAEENGACPQGMTTGYADKSDVFVDLEGLALREGETEEKHLKRLFGVAFGDRPVVNLCLNPELGPTDTKFRTVTAAGVPVEGIDLDPLVPASRTGGACAHDDFPGMQGGSGIDNQFYRVFGCSAQYQSTGLSNSFEIEMLTGSWGVLITLDGIDDIVNDDAVEVGIFASNDPIQLSPGREPLPYATYAIHPEPRFQARTRGRIVNGVLTTEPVDVRIEWVVNSIRLDRPLDDAVLQVTLGEDGALDGYLAGYTQVEDLYNYNFSFRNGTDGTGQLAPIRLRSGSAVGKSFVLGYTCEGVYQALYAHADADPDPETGRCRALSTQYRVAAIPAFVVANATAGSNENLDAAGYRRDGVYEATPTESKEAR